MRSAIFCCALLGLQAAPVPVSVNSVASTHVPPEFVSFTVDAGQFFPGHFWKDNVSFPFRSKTMISLAKALSPAIFRMGGTEADKLWYDVQGCFSVDRCSGRAENFTEAVSKESLDDLFTFARSAGYKVAFGLNAVTGPRNAHGEWTPDNAAELIAFAAKHYPNISGWWELGNEPEAWIATDHRFTSGAQLVRDYQTLRRTLQNVAPTHKIAGIDASGVITSNLPSLLPSFLSNGGDAVVDAVTYHWYPLIGNCQGILPMQLCKFLPFVASVEKAITSAFNETEDKFVRMQKLANGKPLWLGEGALAVVGGRDGVTNVFASTLFYLFELGQAAITSHSVVLRQALAGASYSLIDEHSQTPLPDYWGALLHKRLMGTQVHKVTIAWPLRAFAHCHPSQSEQVTVLVVNPTGNGKAINMTQAAKGPITLHLLTADNLESQLTSTGVKINGQRMVAVGGEIPAIPRATIPAGREYNMPVFSAAFFTFPFDSCTQTDMNDDTHDLSSAVLLI